ncbi:MAG TPA: UDP-2,3-diacylglucosamine diphosphatase LpxI [Caulobacteraceae bacterium]|nr:UDP-2,3-diacylglucosamine diphosphatase LpxI [Caulobacteraceae bacterium]
MKKLGLIAGGGALPVSLARHCRDIGRPLFIIRLAGFADPDLAGYDGCELGLGRLGAAISALRASGCEAICLAGRVARPNMAELKPDFRGLAALPGVLTAARRGDDGLLSFLIGEFEKEGFVVEGAHEVMADLVLRRGPLARHKPRRSHGSDIDRATAAARAIGRLDAGQAAVACDGLILALEAQEGTDAMLERVARLPPAIRGTPGHRRGVLVKVCKPGQERRVDLPTIGPGTVRRAADAGLAGIAGEASLTIIVERERVIAMADELGLFVVGMDAPRE